MIKVKHIKDIKWDKYYGRTNKQNDDNLRDDLRLMELALFLGYTINNNGIDFPFNALVFENNNIHIWYCTKGWVSAHIINNRFVNHIRYNSLFSALMCEFYMHLIEITIEEDETNEN